MVAEGVQEMTAGPSEVNVPQFVHGHCHRKSFEDLRERFHNIAFAKRLKLCVGG